jgi:putative membrane protein
MIKNHPIDFVEQKTANPCEKQSYTQVDGKDIAKGLIAGLFGGVAGTAAKTLGELLYPPRIHGEPLPPAVLADEVSELFTGHGLSPKSKKLAAECIHWSFGAATGGAYGVLAELCPPATGGVGAGFGIMLMAITHEGLLPVLGLSAKPKDQTEREKSSEMITHILYGVVTETVRRFVCSRV